MQRPTPSAEVLERAEHIARLAPQIMGIIAKMHTPSRLGIELTMNQYHALKVIHELKECSVNEVAHKMKIAQSTASQLVDRLVKSNVVHREIHTGDRRKMVVKLSKTGVQMMEKRSVSLRDSYAHILMMLEEADRIRFENAFNVFYEIAKKLETMLEPKET